MHSARPRSLGAVVLQTRDIVLAAVAGLAVAATSLFGGVWLAGELNEWLGNRWRVRARTTRHLRAATRRRQRRSRRYATARRRPARHERRHGPAGRLPRPTVGRELLVLEMRPVSPRAARLCHRARRRRRSGAVRRRRSVRHGRGDGAVRPTNAASPTTCCATTARCPTSSGSSATRSRCSSAPRVGCCARSARSMPRRCGP